MAKLRKGAIVQGRSVKEEEPQVNKYYLLVSDRYMRAKYVSIMVLALFLAIVIILFRNDITYSNLMYLLRDFNTGDAVSESVFDPINYDEQDNMCFGVFRGELAVAGNRSLRLYNSKGEENRSYDVGYSDPVIITSDKYLMAYDIGSDSFSIFTSIAKVNEGAASGVIECADVNDNGDYLLVSKSIETKYLVSTFDSSFRPITKYYKNNYVTSAALGNDGKTVIASFFAKDGGYACEVEFYPDGEEKASNVYSADGVFPVKCGVWDNGSTYVICSDRILFFDDDGNLTNHYVSWSGFISYSVGENNISLTRIDDTIGANSEILVFDTNGGLLYNNNLEGKVTSLAVSSDIVYALTGDRVTMIPISGEGTVTVEVDDGGAELLVYGHSAVLCKKDGAHGLVFNSNNTNNSEITENVSSTVK